MESDRMALTVLALSGRRRQVLSVLCDVGRPILPSVIGTRLGLNRCDVHDPLVYLWTIGLVRRVQSGRNCWTWFVLPEVPQWDAILPCRTLSRHGGRAPSVPIGLGVLKVLRSSGGKKINIPAVAHRLEADPSTISRWIDRLRGWETWPLAEAA